MMSVFYFCDIYDNYSKGDLYKVAMVGEKFSRVAYYSNTGEMRSITTRLIGRKNFNYSGYVLIGEV